MFLDLALQLVPIAMVPCCRVVEHVQDEPPERKHALCAVPNDCPMSTVRKDDPQCHLARVGYKDSSRKQPVGSEAEVDRVSNCKVCAFTPNFPSKLFPKSRAFQAHVLQLQCRNKCPELLVGFLHRPQTFSLHASNRT